MQSGQTRPVEGYRLIAGYLGVILMLIGCVVLLPLLALIPYPEEYEYADCFIIPGVGAILAGYLLNLTLRDQERGQLRRHQDTVIVVAAWILAILVCSVPFQLTGDYNFTQAVFECTSGWSTTGLSVVDVTAAPKIFLLFRSIMLFFGGVGLVLVMLSVLSDSFGMRLYNAEGHSDKLLPNLVRSSRTIIAIYAGYILGGTLLYILFGMPWFDALNHSIAALSTGGFSTQPDSIGHYHSLSIELVTVVLMLLGCTNFLAHLYLIRGKFRNFFNYCEVRFMLFVVALITPLMAFLLLVGGFVAGLPAAFRDALFQTVSALTTTGFQSIPAFNVWTPALLFLVILLQLTGGGTGSTAGGIKQFRVYVMLKNAFWSFRDKFSNQRLVRADRVRHPDRDEFLDVKDRNEVNTFVLLYLLVFLLGSFLISCFGYSIGGAMFEFSSALGTVGLSVGITAYDAPAAVLWVEIVGMFVGRLEIYAVFLAAFRVIRDVRGGAAKRRRHYP